MDGEVAPFLESPFDFLGESDMRRVRSGDLWIVILRVNSSTFESALRLHLTVMLVSNRVSAFLTCCDPYEPLMRSWKVRIKRRYREELCICCGN